MTTNEPEKPAESAEALEALEADEATAETTQQPAVRTVDLQRPGWLTRTVAVAGGVAAATFVVGGAAGYAIGHSTGDDDRSFPTRFTHDGDGFRGGGPGFRPGQNQQGQQGQQGQAPQQAPGTNS